MQSFTHTFRYYCKLKSAWLQIHVIANIVVLLEKWKIVKKFWLTNWTCYIARGTVKSKHFPIFQAIFFQMKIYSSQNFKFYFELKVYRPKSDVELLYHSKRGKVPKSLSFLFFSSFCRLKWTTFILDLEQSEKSTIFKLPNLVQSRQKWFTPEMSSKFSINSVCYL